MAEEIKVKMRLCVRKPDGTIKCKDDGYQATYKKGQVGPSEVSISYPD